jgi:hypothetical protein
MDIYLIQKEFNEAKQYFTWVELRPLADGKICVKAAFQLSSQKYYTITVDFPDSYPNAMPSVYVIQPEINSSPHRYNTGNICYLHPTMWNPGIHNLSFVIQRAIKWLNKYEVWKQKGVWPGAEIKH